MKLENQLLSERHLQNILFYMACIAISILTIGGHWDILVHSLREHDLLEPSHLLILSSLITFGIAGMFALLCKDESGRPRSMILVSFSAATLLLGIPADELWHRIFGIDADMNAWSPPHLMMIFSMAGVLAGILAREAKSAKDRRMIMVAGAIFITLFFCFIDYDLPMQARYIKGRPLMAYPVALSIAAVAIFTLIEFLTRRLGIASAAAFLSWSFYSFVGFITGRFTDFFYGFPPFPIFLSAIVFDVYLFLASMNARFDHPSFRVVSMAAMASAAFTYWGTIVWATYLTKISQGLPGGSTGWMIWFVLLIPAVFCASFSARLMAGWINRER